MCVPANADDWTFPGFQLQTIHAKTVEWKCLLFPGRMGRIISCFWKSSPYQIIPVSDNSVLCKIIAFNKLMILRFYCRWEQKNVEFYTLMAKANLSAEAVAKPEIQTDWKDEDPTSG